ncbi:hypothetical protein [Chryseobacterium gregarium]|uniref:hypothetical protein n=1 Tax=Chryseobacterium gregarium TaxID=456299 RepID=UPI0004882B23|nr:hypothetical protein [Chryseobacterium gregarium]
MIKRKYILFIVFFTIVIVSYFYSGNHLQKKGTDNFIKFNSSNLNDKLIATDYYAKGVKIIFKDDEYVFYPLTSSLNNNNIFEVIAEAGDSIYKKPFQKILILKKKNGKEYKYNFREF